MTDIDAWLRSARAYITQQSSTQYPSDDSPTQMAQVMLAEILKKPRAWILSNINHQLTKEQEDQADYFLGRYVQGVPLPYILEHQEFYGLHFKVSPDVLIPRPETEHLVDEAISYLQKNPERRLAVDIGTGSGCIAISLCSHIENIRVVATDISFPSLRIARFNIDYHHLNDRIHLVQTDLFTSFARSTNLICANLPYIPSEIIGSLKVSKFEPSIALNGGKNGLNLIQRLLSTLSLLRPKKCLVLLEIQFDQAEPIHEAVRNLLPEVSISVIKDYASHDRIIRLEFEE